MAEGQLWRMFHCLDSRQGIASVCGVRAEVWTPGQFSRDGPGSPEKAGDIPGEIFSDFAKNYIIRARS